MPDNVTIGVFDQDEDVRNAVNALKMANISDEYISIAAPAGKIRPLDQEIQGFHTTSSRLRAGAKWGGWIGGVAGIIGGAATFLVLPPVGAVVAIGGLATILAGAIEGAVIGAGVGILATALASLGIQEPEARALEQRLAEGEFLVVVKGPAEVVNKADDVLRASNPLHVSAA
jgi:uncharacterized membrane protein